MMKRLGGLLVLVSFIIALLLVGCNSKSDNKSAKVVTYKDLILSLKSAEFKVDEIATSQDDIKYSFFSVAGKFIDLNGERISIYEFNDSTAAKAGAQTISKDGNKIGNSYISWAGAPHFFQQGNLIIGYVGSNKKIINFLTDIAGKPITSE